MSLTIKNFISSEDYQNFIGNDIDFPTEETAEKIIEYLLLKHEPIYLNKDKEDKESDICYFAYNYQALQKELNQNGEHGISQGVILDWNYPTTKYLIKIINPMVKEDDKINMLFIKETLKVWLSLLKISLTAAPFDESLKYGDNDELLIPRLTQDETEFGFEFQMEGAYDNVKTREETVLYIIHKMGQVYTERGNTHGYKEWIEFCRIHLQSVLRTPLVPI